MPEELFSEKTKDGADQALRVTENARSLGTSVLPKEADALAEEALELDLYSFQYASVGATGRCSPCLAKASVMHSLQTLR